MPPVPRASCGVAETAAIARYLAASSARQCGPCLFGLDSLATRLEERPNVAEAHIWLGLVSDKEGDQQGTDREFKVFMAAHGVRRYPMSADEDDDDD